MLRRFAGHYERPFAFLADNDGTEGGATPTDDATNDGSGSGNDAGKQSAQPGAITFASQAEFQKHVDDILKDRLEREAKKRDKAADDARRKAEEDAAAKNGEWQKLAEQHAKRLAELEPLTEQVEAHKAENDRLRDVLKAQVDQLRKDIPAPIIALLGRMDLIEQMQWIAENGEQVAGTNGRAIIKASPNGAGALTRDEVAQQELTNRRKTGMYSI